MPVQQPTSAIKRHGRNWANKKSAPAAKKRNRKMVEESASLEKFVGGVMYLLRRS